MRRRGPVPGTSPESKAAFRRGEPSGDARCTEGREGGPTRVTIEYCPLANYLPVAETLARELRDEFQGAGLAIEIVPSKSGAYEVSVNGRLIFSKRATYRLPEANEIFYHVQAAMPHARIPSAASPNST